MSLQLTVKVVDIQALQWSYLNQHPARTSRRLETSANRRPTSTRMEKPSERPSSWLWIAIPTNSSPFATSRNHICKLVSRPIQMSSLTIFTPILRNRSLRETLVRQLSQLPLFIAPKISGRWTSTKILAGKMGESGTLSRRCRQALLQPVCDKYHGSDYQKSR